MKIHNEEIERKKQEDLDDLNETLEDFKDQIDDESEDYEHIYEKHCDDWNENGDFGNSRHELGNDMFTNYLEWLSICEGRKQILMEMFNENRHKFFDIIEENFPDTYDDDQEGW